MNETKLTLLKKRRVLERLDVFPFIILQSFLLVVYTNDDIDSLIKFVILFISILLQLVVFFSKFWSEKTRTYICFKPGSDIYNSDHLRIDITNSTFSVNNRTEISEINLINGLYITEVDKVNYYYDFEQSKFVKAKYDINKTYKELLNGNSYSNISENELNILKNKYGQNVTNIPVPSFLELYKEHMVAPFFVFQIFCIVLLVFDDYGLHSITTLGMLCFFEATVVGQRIMNLVALRKMKNPPHYIKVYRNNKWTKMSTTDIIPGDIVSVINGNNLEPCLEKKEEEETFFSKLLSKLKEVKKKSDEKRGVKSVNTLISSNKEKEPAPLTCDMLLLSGTAIINESMLTGESIPQMKEPVMKIDNLDSYYNYKTDKLHTLFAGTCVIRSNRDESEDKLPPFIKDDPEDKGCICLVLKTGFNSNQGKLLRTVMFTQDKNHGESKDAFILIFFLLIIALYASYIVFIEGIEREGKITYKLLLRCIIIITSIIPVELPIELSLAINNSLLYLQGKKIMCIEPFRIPDGGKIDTCCFDKTGTLTKDEFILKGIVNPNGSVSTALELNEEGSSIVLGCNSLISIGGKVVGDPIEHVVFTAACGSFQNNYIVNKRNLKIYIEKRYPFDSNLKRMSVLATVFSSVYEKVKYKRVLSKGAPELMKPLFKSVCSNYDELVATYAKRGFRILALGYKDDDTLNVNSIREDAEKDLNFYGLLITETPLKGDTSKYMNELLQADLNCIIITGDHFLTAAKTAIDLNIGPPNVLIGSISEDKIIWSNLDKKPIKETTDCQSLEFLSKEYLLGLTGDQIKILEDKESDENIFKFIKLYCRVQPLQKEYIIKQLLKSGCHASMCGDGSNDVGALKRATIGIALLNSDDQPKSKDSPPENFSLLSLDDDTGIKSGDVTAAAPFTSKSSSIKCVKNIMIRGRCTLTITFQMFKILTLNCLLSAYSMSVLALKGVKFSDFQSMCFGFLIAIFFLMLSRGEPLKKLNKNSPQLYFFNIPTIISLVGQAVVNLLSLKYIIQITEEADPVGIAQVKSFEDPFSPTLMNTVIFIFMMLNNVINFLVNYIGEPFMENLTKNKWMIRLCIGVWIMSIVLVFDLHPDFNEYLELLQMPDDMEYKIKFFSLMILDLIICYVLENWKKILRLYK